MKLLNPLRLLLSLLVGSMLVLSACGGEEETVDETTTTEAADSGEESTTTEAADSGEESTTTEAADGGDAAGVEVILNDDFELLVGSELSAGSITFNVDNVGPDFPHALTIVRADSIDDLPRNEANGAIDTDAMDPADIIGATSSPMAAGVAEDLTVDLEAGNYVFFCPIQRETQSHVGAGQIIEVSVAG